MSELEKHPCVIYALIKNGSVDCMNVSRPFILIKKKEILIKEKIMCDIVQIPFLIDPEKP